MPARFIRTELDITGGSTSSAECFGPTALTRPKASKAGRRRYSPTPQDGEARSATVRGCTGLLRRPLVEAYTSRRSSARGSTAPSASASLASSFA
jgi:hypothetical protein